MTYAQLTNAKSAHELAAKLIRKSGLNARCIKNTLCEQPYEVRVKADVDTCKELQGMLENITRYPVNIVAA